MLDMMVKDNILRVKERIALACSRVSRGEASVKIIAVSKGRTAEQVLETVEAGIIDIGENRVQEALVKINTVRATPHAVGIEWHMVGHLQTNKAKEAVRIFDFIHSVDSLRLAQEIDRQAARINKVQDILIEVKISPEAAKFGLKPDETVEVMERISELKNIRINGLMTIAPVVDKPEQARNYFRLLRELRDKINAIRNTHEAIRELSMGMTDDFEAAIEEGSTMVRIGRAIFEG